MLRQVSPRGRSHEAGCPTHPRFSDVWVRRTTTSAVPYEDAAIVHATLFVIGMCGADIQSPTHSNTANE